MKCPGGGDDLKIRNITCIQSESVRIEPMTVQSKIAV